LMVGVVVAEVESELRGGLLWCPSCAGVLAPWGYARARCVRLRWGEPAALVPRRARCRCCAGTHVLLPDLCLLRRQYEAGLIGAAIEAKARGLGYVRIARELSVPVGTVKAWLRRFSRHAEAIRSHFTRWAFALDAELGPIAPAGGAFADALEAIGVAARAWVLRLGRDRGVWGLVAFLSGGLLLATRGDLFPAVP
jgi:Domain of unknown function (DUF6431)